MDPTTALAAASSGSAVGIAMLKKCLDGSANTVLSLLNKSLNPQVGSNVDIRI